MLVSARVGQGLSDRTGRGGAKTTGSVMNRVGLPTAGLGARAIAPVPLALKAERWVMPRMAKWSLPTMDARTAGQARVMRGESATITVVTMAATKVGATAAIVVTMDGLGAELGRVSRGTKGSVRAA